ncbi:MAG: hypothetical protein ACREQF_05385 [Candidatus Binataceae bacterium]
MESLAAFLGIAGGESLAAPACDGAPSAVAAIDCADAKAFAEAVLRSREFRAYIVCGLLEGTLPPAILGRVMDHGWGKAPDRVEHTGKDGEPIITEVRRVIVHVEQAAEDLELSLRADLAGVYHSKVKH